MAEQSFQELWNAAQAAGRKAAEACAPQPMVVVEADLMSGAPLPGGQSYYVPDGACGFAWIRVRPGNSAFARWLKAKGLGRTDPYAGGVTVSISAYNQSVARKEAHAEAAAQFLRDAGIKAFAESRLD